MKKTYYRGDVYMADLGQGVGSEQGGSRPVVIVQNDTGNHYSPTVIVAAMTSKGDSKAKLPTHFTLEGFTQVPSLVLCEQVRTLDKQRLGEHLGRLTQKEIQQLDYALAVSFGLRRPPKKRKEKIHKSALTMTLCPTCADAFCWDGEHTLKRVDPISPEKDLCTFCGQRSAGSGMGMSIGCLNGRRAHEAGWQAVGKCRAGFFPQGIHLLHWERDLPGGSPFP